MAIWLPIRYKFPTLIAFAIVIFLFYYGQLFAALAVIGLWFIYTQLGS